MFDIFGLIFLKSMLKFVGNMVNKVTCCFRSLKFIDTFETYKNTDMLAL